LENDLSRETLAVDESRKKARWREITIVVIVLAVAVIWGLMSPDFSRHHPPTQAPTERADDPAD